MLGKDIEGTGSASVRNFVCSRCAVSPRI